MSINEAWIKYKKQGDKDAKETLIIHYVNLVKIIAGRLYNTYNANVEFDDLVSYGVIGLIDAIEKYDMDKNVKFETYANIRIRGAVIDQIRALDWVPRSTRQKYKKLEAAISKLQGEYGMNVPDRILADHLGITLEELGKLLSEVTTYSVMSLEEKISENSNFSLTSQDLDFQPEEKLFDIEDKKALVQMIEKLAEKERMVINLYYFSELTYKEISSVLEISESRISQIHTKAIAKLKSALRDNL